MKVASVLDYDNKTKLEEDITNLLDKLYCKGIDAITYDGLEAFRDELYLARLEYDKSRLPKKKRRK